MTSEPEAPEAGTSTRAGPAGGAALGTGTWVILPTYNEAENLPGISAAILDALPGATLLVVDDGSPDGTGELADGLAAADPRVRVQHRPGKQGLGRAYLDGFGVALGGGATSVVQMDADWSHDPDALPALLAPIDAATAPTSSSARRYTRGRRRGGLGHRPAVISRGGCIFARIVLRLEPHDLTGGFKAWRATTLARVPFDGVRAGGYVFQIEMTYRALAPRRPDRRGADHVPRPAGRRVEDEPPDHRRGAVRRRSLRWDELRGRGPVPAE